MAEPESGGGASRLRAGFALALAVILTRVPFLGAGYGTDNDAWAVVAAARNIARTGQYQVSRFPGFPLHEFAVALLQFGGPWAVNGVSALACAASAVLLWGLLRRAGARDAWLGALAFSFVPAVYVGSTAGMDYLWACALLLLAFTLALDRRSVAAGLMLGLATACRITSIAYLLPLGAALSIAEPRGRGRVIAGLVLPAVFASALAYLPVYLRYGASFLSYYEPAGGHLRSGGDFLTGLATLYRLALPPLFVVGLATVGVWGILGAAAVAVVLVAAIARHITRRGAVPPSGTPGAPRVLNAGVWVGVAVGLVLFLRLPDDEGYLVPAVPFALVLLARHGTPALFRALSVALLISPFVLGVDASPPKKAVTPLQRSPLAQRFPLGRETFVLDPARGPLLMDFDKRRAQIEILARARSLWPELPPNAVVVAGLLDLPLHIEIGYGPVSTYDLLTLDHLRALRAEGRPVYYLPDAPERTRRFFHYSLEEEGARPLLPTHFPASADSSVGTRPAATRSSASA